MSMREPLASDGTPYDWALVATLGVTETISYGALYYAFTVFIAPMQAELGWSRTALTGAFSLALLLSGVAGLFAGRWLDHYGPHALMTLGSCGAAALLLAWSRVQSLLAFYLIWAALGVVMSAVLYEPAFWIVARRFSRQRGRALTALTFIAGFASVIFVPLAGALTQAQGWRGALVTLAIILALGTIPAHALALRGATAATAPATDPRASPAAVALHGVSHGVSRGEALRSPAFWWIAAAFFLITLSTSALSAHLAPLLTDRGYSPAFAAAAVGAFGLMALPGRLIFTPLGDRFRRSRVISVIFILHALGMLALLLAPGMVGIIAFVALFGTGFGAVTPARAALVADVYGPAHYGQISGVVALAMMLARALGPLAMSLAYDHAGSYTLALLALIAAALTGALALRFADQRVR